MVFTLDEQVNLPACLDSLHWCRDVVVVDSFSDDRTEAIAVDAGARFFQRRFDGFGSQRNWALAHTDPVFDWVLILDADERVPPALVSEMAHRLTTVDPRVGAFKIRRRFHMWGKWLRYSSMYPTWVVRLVHRDRVRYINRGHAETQEVSGTIATLDNDLIDENLKGMDAWFARQNTYSSRDAEYELAMDGEPRSLSQLWSADPLIRRKALKRLAAAIPGRSFTYFVYAYMLRGGFRDGRAGFYFCLMRSLYQGMVETKKYDLRRRDDSAR